MEFEFSKNGTVTDINVVPEHFRSMYSADPAGGGKFTLNPALASTASAIDGLNNANRKIREEKEQQGKRLVDPAPFLALGATLGIEGDVNPETLRKALETIVDKATKGDTTFKADLAKLREDAAKSLRGVEEKHAGERAALEGTVFRYLVEKEAAMAMTEPGLKGNAELLMPHLRAAAKVVKDGEEYVVRIFDGEQPRGDGKGGYMGVRDLIKEYKVKYPGAFDSSTPAGGGAPPGGSQRPAGGPPSNGAVKSSHDKISAGLKAGGFTKAGAGA